MKKKSQARDELGEEYRFDYGRARPNRFAARIGADVIAVVLEPDVAEVFHSSESVNQLLRSVISAWPPRKNPTRRTRAKGDCREHLR